LYGNRSKSKAKATEPTRSPARGKSPSRSPVRAFGQRPNSGAQCSSHADCDRGFCDAGLCRSF
jgi:hypothetical protein